MAKIEDWHRRAARGIEFQYNAWDQEERQRGVIPTGKARCEKIAQLIADHAPASTASKEVIEKYAKELLAMNSDYHCPINVFESLLTRFASEIQTAGGGK